MKSKWKIVNYDYRVSDDKLNNFINNLKEKDKRLMNTSIFIISRAGVITSDLINKRIAVYNGHTFISFMVKPMMLFHKFGEFSLTKKLGPIIHKMKKKGSKLKGKKK